MQVLLRKAFSLWRHLSLCSALSAAQEAVWNASVAAKAAKAVADLEAIQSAKLEPRSWNKLTRAQEKQPDVPLTLMSSLPDVQRQHEQQQVLQQLQFPAQQQGMMSLVPFTIPAVGPTASPAILAMPLQLAAYGQLPAGINLVHTHASQQGLLAQPGQGMSPSTAETGHAPSMAATRSKQPSGPVSSPACPLLPAEQAPMLAEESSDWTTVSTEAVVEVIPPKRLHGAEALRLTRGVTLQRPCMTGRQLSAGRVRGDLGQGGCTVAPAARVAKVPHQQQLSGRCGDGSSQPNAGPLLTQATAVLNPGCQESSIPALTSAGASNPAQHLCAGPRKLPPGVKKMILTGNNSPSPWVPSSRHARVLQSFDMKPGAAVRPQSSGRGRAGAGNSPSNSSGHDLALGPGKSSNKGAPGAGAEGNRAATTMAAAAEGQHAELPDMQLQPEAVTGTVAVIGVPLADPGLMSGPALAAQSAESNAVRQGPHPGLQPAVASARVQTPEGVLPEPRHSLPTMYPLPALSSAPQPGTHTSAAVEADSSNREGSECVAGQSMPPGQVPTGAADTNSVAVAASTPQPLAAAQASVVAHTRQAAACSLVPKGVVHPHTAPAPPTCEAGSRAAMHAGVQVRRVAVNTPVIVRRGIAPQAVGRTSPLQSSLGVKEE